MNDHSHSLQGLRILVTGHTGFKGAWLVSLLQFLGADVIGLSDSIRPTSLYSRIQNELDISEYFIDIRDEHRLSRAILDIRPDGVFHLAAQSLVIDSFNDPATTFQTNILGTANLILSAYKLPSLKFVIVVTTDKVYKNENTGLPFVENAPFGGDDPYSASKAAAELVTHSLRNFPGQLISFPIPTVRAGNVIGGGDDSNNRLLPDITKSVIRNSPLVIRNPESVRPWQHVLDPLNGYVQLASRLAEGDDLANSYNFGPTNQSFMTVQEVASRALQEWNVGSKVTINPPNSMAFPESQLLLLDSSKAARDLNWNTKLTATEAINWTVSWEKRCNLNGESPFELITEQIKSFAVRERAL